MLKLAISGCTGRMGQILLFEVNKDPEIELVGALTRVGNPFVGQDVGTLIGESPLSQFITDRPEEAFQDADVVIDFSHPDALDIHLKEATNKHKPYVVCVTGVSDQYKSVYEKASKEIPLLLAPNTSLGIALLKKLAVWAAEILGPSYDISLLEMHHRHKKDAPSGSSLGIAKALQNIDRLNHNVPPYPSQSPRSQGTIECAVLRGGGVAGDHSVIFAGEKEVLTFEHRALDRALFAQGALKAASWLFKQPPGLYTMDDVIGFSL